MKKILLVFILGCSLLPLAAQQETVEEFIISVTSNYKNPLAYYPLRQDIFLPSDEELNILEKQRDRPHDALVTGSFIFMDKEEPIKRDPFITASGELMFFTSKYRGLSRRSTLAYHQRKHDLLVNKHTNLGKFLWYNRQFKALR